ncbi:MAG: S41 family peptidase [Candidatus Aminicenantales bacterium]
MPRYRLVLLTVFVASLLFFLIQMRILPGTAQRSSFPKGFELVDILMQLIRNDYLEERDPVQTAEGTYRGIVNSLDPVSSYLNKDLTAKYAARKAGDTEPGLFIYKKYETFPVVVGVVPGSPAEKADIKPGDLVSAIGHRNTLNLSMTEVNLLLAGTDETPVAVKILRGNQPRELSLPRAVVFPRAYTFMAAAGRPAVLSIHGFPPSLNAEISRSVVPALKAGKKPFILDLRNCTSGDIEEARAFTNLFLKAAAVGTFEKKGGVKDDVVCLATPELAGIPVVVWTNAATIGPAEFVAGVLQEIGKVKVLGQPTPGAVARTERYPLKDGSSIILVSGVFSLPSGRSLWGQGLNPDVTIAAADQSEKAYLDKTLPLLSKL